MGGRRAPGAGNNRAGVGDTASWPRNGELCTPLLRTVKNGYGIISHLEVVLTAGCVKG